MKTKRPAFQFYPADWLNDLELRQCSALARAIWMDMICLMHDGSPYGHLATTSGPISARFIASKSAATLKQVNASIRELESHGVLSKTPEGVIYSRRMVRDEERRNLCVAGGNAGAQYGHLGSEHGIKGGRPRKYTGVNKPPLETPLKPPASSSSSSPSSIHSPSGECDARPQLAIAAIPPPDTESRIRKLAEAQPDPQDFEQGIELAVQAVVSSANPAKTLSTLEAHLPLWWESMRTGAARMKPLRFVIVDRDYLRRPREPTAGGQKQTQSQAALALMKKRIERGEAPL